MDLLILFSFAFLFLLIPFFYLCRKYRNPYRLYMVFGKKGSGKTTFLAKTAYQYLKKGYKVYSTERIPGVIRFDINDIGKVTFPENSVLLIDEAGMKYDNRHWKNFSDAERDYYKYQRHEKHIVYLFSQTFDIDAKLRNLTDCMYLCTCKFGWLSIARKIRRDVTLVHPQGDSESRIADDLEFEPIFLSLFGAKTCILTYIPRWVCLFDSHEKLGLSLHDDDLPAPVPSAAAKLFKFQQKSRSKRKRRFKTMCKYIRSFFTKVFALAFSRRINVKEKRGSVRACLEHNKDLDPEIPFLYPELTDLPEWGEIEDYFDELSS